jgi:eukaryotic-like serine/threonine-protein kinase
MSVAPRTRIGPYQVISMIGAGGMGEVYRARDTRLDRTVAIKVLPEAFAADAQRVARFQREAKVLASLNHPHIAAIYGFEEADGVKALVMELVEGPTLADRIAQGPIPLDEALPIAKQIAEALEAAHEQGIIHRDLKPANVKVRSDGTVKVLDFGLAMEPAVESASVSQSPTITTPAMTQAGVILGTAAYMSPEQARGQLVDRRTDIWAFGCCLYECLTGRSAFAGKTVSDTLAAVLDKNPDWSALSDGVPHAVRRLLRRLLAKDVRHRLQHIGDARLELEEIGNDANEPSAAVRRPRRAVPVLLSGAALLAIATGLASWLVGRWPTAQRESAVARLSLTIEGETAENLRLPVDRFFTPFALSPDGLRLVFYARGSGRSQLFLRELSGFQTRPIPGTELATTPFFSPDGQWIGFWRAEDRILRKVSLAGGSPIEIAPTDVPLVALWTSNDEIVIESGDQVGELWSIPASGGTPQNNRRPGSRRRRVDFTASASTG